MTTNSEAFIAEGIANHPAEAAIIALIVEVTNAAHDPITSAYPREGWDSPDDADVIEAGNLSDINNIAFNLDYVTLETASGRIIQIVMGEGWECMPDYSLSLEHILKPVEALVEKWMR
jgi:hypothetical protein